MIQNGCHGRQLKWLTEAMISKGSEGVLSKDPGRCHSLHTIDIKFQSEHHNAYIIVWFRKARTKSRTKKDESG